MRFLATCLYVADVGAALAFYKEAFGFEPHHYDRERGYAEMDAAGATLALASHTLGASIMDPVYPMPPDGRPVGVEIAFEAADVAGAFQRAVNAGALPLAAPEVMDWGWTLALVRSPDGAMIGIAAPPPQPETMTLPAENDS